MAKIYTRVSRSNTIYYGDITINNKRYRKKLATSKEAAIIELKKWEYELLFTKPKQAKNEYPIYKARLSFLKDLELLANKIADTLDDEFHIYDTEPHVPDGANEVLLDHSMGTHVSRVIQRAILMHIKD